MRGAEPCVGVDLTHLTHRQRPSGSVLGVRMSHAVVDAAGMHRAVAEIARIYRSRVPCVGDSEPSFRRLSACRAPILDAMSSISYDAARHQQIDLGGFRGMAIWYAIRCLQRNQNSKRTRRARLSFSRADLGALQQLVPRAENAGEALCGRLLSEMALLIPRARPFAVRLAMPVNMRRVSRFLDDKVDYTGNAVHVMASEGLVRLGAEDVGSTELTDMFLSELQSVSKKVRDDPDSVTAEWLEHARKVEDGILVSPSGTGDGEITLVVNSHRQLSGTTTLVPGLDLFGKDAGRCVHFVPGQSDAVQLLPGVGGNQGGVDVLITLPPALSPPQPRGGGLGGQWFRRRVMREE